MKRLNHCWLGFLLMFFLMPRPNTGQVSNLGVPGFPDKLLEGDPSFSLAIFFQGDLKGNFAPCG